LGFRFRRKIETNKQRERERWGADNKNPRQGWVAKLIHYIFAKVSGQEIVSMKIQISF
jgi:hypothetical protein